jgi:hypothetical protein
MRHTARSAAVEAWQADNEPFLPTPRAHSWRLSEEWVTAVVDRIRALDAKGRPVVVAHSSANSRDDDWRLALAHGDVLGQSVYPVRSMRPLGLFIPYPSLLAGPFAPNLPAQAKLARGQGKGFWLTEMQAEPWDRTPTAELGNRKPRTMSPGQLEKNIRIARRSGATRVYLWGAEWWHALAVRYGNSTYEEVAGKALTAPATGRPAD